MFVDGGRVQEYKAEAVGWLCGIVQRSMRTAVTQSQEVIQEVMREKMNVKRTFYKRLST